MAAEASELAPLVPKALWRAFGAPETTLEDLPAAKLLPLWRALRLHTHEREWSANDRNLVNEINARCYSVAQFSRLKDHRTPVWLDEFCFKISPKKRRIHKPLWFRILGLFVTALRAGAIATKLSYEEGSAQLNTSPSSWQRAIRELRDAGLLIWERSFAEVTDGTRYRDCDVNLYQLGPALTVHLEALLEGTPHEGKKKRRIWEARVLRAQARRAKRDREVAHREAREQGRKRWADEHPDSRPRRRKLRPDVPLEIDRSHDSQPRQWRFRRGNAANGTAPELAPELALASTLASTLAPAPELAPELAPSTLAPAPEPAPEPALVELVDQAPAPELAPEPAVELVDKAPAPEQPTRRERASKGPIGPDRGGSSCTTPGARNGDDVTRSKSASVDEKNTLTVKVRSLPAPGTGAVPSARPTAPVATSNKNPERLNSTPPPLSSSAPTPSGNPLRSASPAAGSLVKACANNAGHSSQTDTASHPGLDGGISPCNVSHEPSDRLADRLGLSPTVRAALLALEATTKARRGSVCPDCSGLGTLQPRFISESPRRCERCKGSGR